MVWIELSACEIHFGASTKFLDYRVYVRYDMQAQDETSHNFYEVLTYNHMLDVRLLAFVPSF
jgi:hypothetical protein